MTLKAHRDKAFATPSKRPQGNTLRRKKSLMHHRKICAFKNSNQTESGWLHPASIRICYDLTLILLLTLNKNLLVSPLNQSIAQRQANSESSAGWKFRHKARHNGIFTDPLSGLFRSIGCLKSHVILHPFFARDTADCQKNVLGWWDNWWSNVRYFEWLWKGNVKSCLTIIMN